MPVDERATIASSTARYRLLTGRSRDVSAGAEGRGPPLLCNRSGRVRSCALLALAAQVPKPHETSWLPPDASVVVHQPPACNMPRPCPHPCLHGVASAPAHELAALAPADRRACLAPRVRRSAEHRWSSLGWQGSARRLQLLAAARGPGCWASITTGALPASAASMGQAGCRRQQTPPAILNSEVEAGSGALVAEVITRMACPINALHTLHCSRSGACAAAALPSTEGRLPLAALQRRQQGGTRGWACTPSHTILRHPGAATRQGSGCSAAWAGFPSP